jgi:phosphoribosylamine--glycine ligase
VLGVSAAADTLAEALARAYEAIEKIQFEAIYFRRDIGNRALKKL